MKNFLKSLIFITIFVIIYNKVFDVLWLTKNSVSSFYDEPKDSLDVVYIGASNVYVHFNTTLAYKQYGFTTGILSEGNQPPTMVKYLMKEAAKYQHPELYIIDINQFSKDFSDYTEGDFRKNVDSLKFSKNKIDAVDEFLKYVDIEKNDPNSQSGNDKINYYFSFLKYHNSWKEITEQNFNGNPSLYKSFLIENYTFLNIPFEDYKWTKDREPLVDGMENILDDLISYIKENNINVLFVVPNKAWKIIEDANPARLNTIIDKLEENNFKVINFNTLDDFKIDLSTELHNGGHINVYGATKYTLYFSKYLKENYNLKDHRNDKKYESWDKEYERLKNKFRTKDGRDYDDVVEEYKKELELLHSKS